MKAVEILGYIAAGIAALAAFLGFVEYCLIVSKDDE